MKSIISPSLLAIKALGIEPEGTEVAKDDCECAVCGTAIRSGEVVDNLRLPESFTNRAALANPSGRFRCGACTAVMTRKEFQMGLSTAIFGADGYFPIMKKESRAWAFMNPPQPPFSICIQNAQQQHVVWRAPVTLSRDLLLVRVGEQVVRIRREKLMAARLVAISLNEKRQAPEQTNSAGSKRQRGRPETLSLESPFISDWKLQSAEGGRIKWWVEKLSTNGLVDQSDLDLLFSLNGGEVWALSAVLADPVQPESINFQ